MSVMSVPAQQKPSTKRTGKRITFFNEQSVGMKEPSQHPEGSYYVPAGTASDPGQSEAASTVTSNPEGPHMYLNSVIFSPDKGDQSRSHYQQTVPMKWAQQESSQQQQSQQQRAVSWSTMSNWGQNMANYIGGVNVTDSRNQNAFAKSIHETSGLQPHQQLPNRDADKLPNPVAEAYREALKAREMEWEQHQSQTFQETLKPGVLNTQQQRTSQPGGSSVLQPFQLAFGQPKPHLPAYYQAFQGNRTTLPNPPIYSAQAKPMHHLQQLKKQGQVCQQQHHISQQQIHQQQHQQIIQHQQHVQLQHQQHVQLQQQQQQQQQQLQHEQQQQKIQQQKLQIQHQMQHQQLRQQNPHVLDYYPGTQNAHPHPQPVVVHSQESCAPAPLKIQEPIIQDITPETQQPSEPLQPPLQSEPPSQSQPQLQSQTQLRRSRRLSKEGGAPSDNPFLPLSLEQTAPGPQGSQNGASDIQAAPTGVIQSTCRKRRVSQEANLETLAQKASEMESLPSHVSTQLKLLLLFFSAFTLLY